MTSFCRALAVAAALGASGLPACVPPPADYTESEWPKNLRLDPAPAQLAVGFAPGSSRILPGDLARLRATAASGGIVPSDRVVVAVAGPPALAAARFDAVAASLLPYGIVPSPAPGLGAPPGAAVIRRERYLVTLAAVPQLEQAGRRRRRFHEHRVQQFRMRRRGQSRLDGRATPADLVEARQLGFDRCTPRCRRREQLSARQGPVAGGGKHRADRRPGEPARAGARRRRRGRFRRGGAGAQP